MTRDYAKPRYTKTQERYAIRARPKQTPGWIWLLTGLLLGSLMVGFYWFIENKNRNPLATSLQEEPVTKASEQATTDLAIEKPRFDFYTLLPNMDVTVSDPGSPQEHSASQAPPAPPVFLIQVGSFQEYSLADTLKAELVLMGIDDPKIQPIEINPGEKRFRVFFGPFQEEKEAQLLLQQLKAQAVSGSIILNQ